MYKDKSVLAIIPARSGSKGLPGKNIRYLAGKPLLAWPVHAAKGSAYVDKVIVSTDDEGIAEKALEHGAEIPFLRPKELATDTASSASVIEHAILFLQNEGHTFDYFVLLEPTSPLTESADVDKAIEMLDSRRDVADSLMGVAKVEATHPEFSAVISENGLLKPYFSEDFAPPKRRQDITELYYFEGSIYLSDVLVYLRKKTFYHDRTLPFVMPRWKAIEVDEMVDLICVEAILNNMDIIRQSCR
jgi:N-acylneuraminate cytidylyltransferase/CMP-N,N'-diacetyllegionaminic acid synthase